MSNNRKLYAFGYRARVGKDTAADYLSTKYGGERFAFSKALYDILHFAQSRCGFPLKKDRQFLQYIGTEWARSQEEDVWVNILVKDVKGYINNSKENIYVTDVRFPNEFNALKELGFTMIQIKGDPKSEFGSGSSNHKSEVALSEYEDSMWDHIIINDGSLVDFHEKLDALLKKV
jgi:Deoxynucleotide monophosphate kinase